MLFLKLSQGYMSLYVRQAFNRARLFATPWTAARQAPLSMGFSGKDTRVVCHFLFQGIFLTHGARTWVPCSAGRFFTD